MRFGWRRFALTLLLTIVTVSTIGFGGLAGWQIETSNAANSFAGGTLTMTNGPNGTSGSGCATTTSTPTVGGCAAILSAPAMYPGSPAVTGNVTIDNTGTLAGTYYLSASDTITPSTNTTICSDMNITITDDAAPANTIYSGTIAGLVSATSTTPITLPDSFPALTGTHTFYFQVSMASTAPITDMGATCTATFNFLAQPV